MDFGLNVDDTEGVKITIDGEAFKDSTFEGGKEATLPHDHIRLIRDVKPLIMGDSIGTGEITLEPATQYVIKDMTNLEFGIG